VGGDETEETGTHAVEVELRRTEQAQAVVAFLGYEGPDPGFQRKCRDVHSETAHHTVPELRGAAHKGDLWRFSAIYAGSPTQSPRRDAE
jgi:hypothetical protein